MHGAGRASKNASKSGTRVKELGAERRPGQLTAAGPGRGSTIACGTLGRGGGERIFQRVGQANSVDGSSPVLARATSCGSSQKRVVRSSLRNRTSIRRPPSPDRTRGI